MSFGIENSSIPKTGVKPHIINGAFLQICRAVFSSSETISEESLKRYIWHPDSKISRILIESMYRWKTEDVQERPAVLVKRGPWKIGRLGIADEIMSGIEDTGFEEAQHIVATSGGHVFQCLGTTGLEAELLGTEIYRTLLGFSKVIREQLCLGKFQVEAIGEIKRFDESHVHFVVPVTVTYEAFTHWELLRQTPEWMRTSFRTEIVNNDF